MPYRAVLAIGLLGACAHGPATASANTAGWHAVKTPHFRVYTDAPEAQARAQALRLESLRASLLLAFPPGTDTPLPVEVVVFASRDALSWFVSPRQLGYTRYSDSELRIVMSAEAFADGESQFTATVAHELTHYLSQYAVKQQPRWLAEGLATFLETLTLTADGRAVFGRAPYAKLVLVRQLFGQERSVYGQRETMPWLWQWSALPLAQVRALPEDQESGSYALAWAWLHLLMNQRRPQLDAFFAGLNRGEAPQDAFTRAFAADPPGSLEARLRAYVFTNMPGWSLMQPDVSQMALEVTPLSEAAVHALRAKLFVRDRPPVQEPQRFIDFELNEALRLDPKQTDARELRAEQAQDYAAAKQLALETDDDTAWALLAQLLIEGPARDADAFRQEVFARAGARLQDPRALTLAALGMGMLGDLNLAKRHAERARVLAPWSTGANVAMAVVAKLLGDCAAADEAERTALALLRHRADAAAADAMARKLAALKCPP
jgi:hypothetical protein